MLDKDAIAAVMPGSDPFELDTTRVRDITPLVLGQDGRMQVLPASFWASTTPDERALFGHRHGLYSFPTVELVEHLRMLTTGRKAIEIGAGHGVLADALGIPGTDSRHQEEAKYEFIYRMARQPTVPYGPNIIKMHASRAVRHYKPDVAIGCFITHKWDKNAPELGGNEVGIDMKDVLSQVHELIMIGNVTTHAKNPVWKFAHTIEHPSWLASRSRNGAPDFLARFRGWKR